MIYTCVFLNGANDILFAISVFMSMLALMFIPLHMKECLELLMVQQQQCRHQLQWSSSLWSWPMTKSSLWLLRAWRSVGRSHFHGHSFSLLIRYFVFGMSFPSRIQRSLTFLQKVHLNHHDSIKRHPKVLTLLAKLPSNSHIVTWTLSEGGTAYFAIEG